jgi:hypothetical protein
MNQTLATIKKIIISELESCEIEYGEVITEEDGQPLIAYKTEYGFGLFSDKENDEVVYFVMTEEKDTEEDSEYVRSNLKNFIEVLCGRMNPKKLLKNG